MERAVDDSGGWTDGRPGGLARRPAPCWFLAWWWSRSSAEPSREQAAQGQSTTIACRAGRLQTFPECVELMAAIGASNRCRLPPIAPMMTRHCSGAQRGASALRRAGRASDAIAGGGDVAAIGALPAPTARLPASLPRPPFGAASTSARRAEWAGGYSPSASGMISQNNSKSLSACGCGPLLTTISLLMKVSPSKVTWNTM